MTKDSEKSTELLSNKIRFLGLTYLITILSWVLIVYIAPQVYLFIDDHQILQKVANVDRYKVVLVFIVLMLLGNQLDKLPKPIDVVTFIIRFLAIVAIIICINIRWDIDMFNADYYFEVLNLVVLMFAAQLIRVSFLFIENKRIVKIIVKLFTNLMFILMLCTIFYLVFTIAERSDDNSLVLYIDSVVFYIIKLFVVFFAFVFDYAFVEKAKTSKVLPYNLTGVKTTEYFKAASLRLRYLLFVYFFIAGTILSDKLINYSM